jgi:hypothetical protein
MANRTFYPSQNYGIGRVYCEFKFNPQGSATSVPLSAVSGADVVASITHVAGGNKFTITLKDAFNDVIAQSGDIVETSGGAGSYATVGNFQNLGTKNPVVFDVRTWVASGSALNDPANTVTVSVVLVFKNTYGGTGIK